MIGETAVGQPPISADLVVEVMVRDLDRSLAFYLALGFELERKSDGFAVVSWGGRQVFLDEKPDTPDHGDIERANLRIMVADVDAMWHRAETLKASVIGPIADRSYGLRDFTIRDPDGFGLRFARRIPDARSSREEQ